MIQLRRPTRPPSAVRQPVERRHRRRCHGKHRTSVTSKSFTSSSASYASHPLPSTSLSLYTIAVLPLVASCTVPASVHSKRISVLVRCRSTASPACVRLRLPIDVTLSSIRSNIDPSQLHTSSLLYASTEPIRQLSGITNLRSCLKIIARSACTTIELRDCAVVFDLSSKVIYHDW